MFRHPHFAMAPRGATFVTCRRLRCSCFGGPSRSRVLSRRGVLESFGFTLSFGGLVGRHAVTSRGWWGVVLAEEMPSPMEENSHPVADGTASTRRRSQGLASCETVERPWCFSSYDDRPAHFYQPVTWDDARARRDVFGDIIDLLRQRDFDIVEKNDDFTYMAATDGRLMNVELEFLESDDVVTVRITPTDNAASASGLFSKPSRAEAESTVARLLTDARMIPVPILRNRKRVLGVFESPFDSFGPEPPPFDEAIDDAL